MACLKREKAVYSQYIHLCLLLCRHSINSCWRNEIGGHSKNWTCGYSLTETIVLFSRVWEKAVLTLLSYFMKYPLHCVCISHVSFMLKKKNVLVWSRCHLMLAGFCLHHNHEHDLSLADDFQPWENNKKFLVLGYSRIFHNVYNEITSVLSFYGNGSECH